MAESAEFEPLALKYLDSLHNYARILARDATDAQDLLQDALLRAFRGFPSFNRDLNAKVWLLKVMKNTHIDRCRQKLARPIEDALDGDEVAVDGTAPLNPEEILLRRLAIEEVRGA